MKIAINGDIIDTKDIYKVTPIIKCALMHSDTGNWIEVCEKNSRNDTNGFSIIFFNKTCNDFANKSKDNLEVFRNNIIKIWSKNQLEIPQFNLE